MPCTLQNTSDKGKVGEKGTETEELGEGERGGRRGEETSPEWLRHQRRTKCTLVSRGRPWADGWQEDWREETPEETPATLPRGALPFMQGCSVHTVGSL